MLKLNVDSLFKKNKQVFNCEELYSIGDIIHTENNNNPNAKFGGTWIKLTECFLYAVSSGVSVNSGTNSQTLTVNQLPKHKPVTEAYETIACARWAWESGSGSYFAVNDNQSGYRIRAIANIGNDEGHNNMPAYRKVYMWKKTA